MDSSHPVLRAQGEDEFRVYDRRVKNENNKLPLEPQNSKPVLAPYLPNRDLENQDPGRKMLVRPKASRLPVLVKSHKPASAFHASQWEEKLLTGKAKKRKSCTRPRPFNKSQHKSLKINIVTSQSKSGAHAIQPKNNVCVKTHKIKEKPPECPGVLKSTGGATKEKYRSPAMVSRHDTLKTESVAHHRNPSSSSVCLDNTIHLNRENARDNLSSHPSDKAERFHHTALLSSPHNEDVQVSSQPFAAKGSQSCAKSHQKAASSQNEGMMVAGSVHATILKSSGKVTFMDAPQRVPIKKSQAIEDKAAEFQPNPTSLLSILRNEGVCISSKSVATPRSQSCTMFPQRASVTSTHRKAPASQNERVKASATPQKSSINGTSIDTPQRVLLKKSLTADKTVDFKPDPTSLQSIQRNEAMWNSSQSITTPRSQSKAILPQRVSAAKSRQKAAAAAGPVRATPHKPPLPSTSTFIDTPQRIPVKKGVLTAVSTQKDAKNMWTSQKKSSPSPAMHVVQKLFVDQEDGQSPDKRKEEMLPVHQVSPIKTHGKDKEKMNGSWGNEEEQKTEKGQQSIQTLQRESVNIFSTGKKQRSFENQEILACQELLGQDPSEMVDVCKPVNRINLADQILYRDQKASAANTELALLPKCLSQMEDLRLDKEIAFYFSHSIPDTPNFYPSLQCCRDPVASLLDFEESTKFVPLCMETPSPHSSPLQEKELSNVPFS